MMFDFLRPVQDSSLRIMIPTKRSSSIMQDESPCEFDDEERDATFPSAIDATNSNMLRYSSGSLLAKQASPSSSTHLFTTPSRVNRSYKTYTVMQRSGFQHTEYVQIITHLCKAEIMISLFFLIHGFTCPGYPNESSYQGTCHINILAALVGIFTGGMGLGAVHRFRWKTVLVMWLIMCIISSVANLLAVITTGVWLDHLSKLKTRTGMANGLSGMMLLGSVLVGVCFILTSVLICHYWASNSTKYQAVGRIAKRTRSLRHRLSRANSGESPSGGRFANYNGYHSGYGSGGSNERNSNRRNYNISPQTHSGSGQNDNNPSILSPHEGVIENGTITEVKNYSAHGKAHYEIV